jgi:hypothetical protein
VTHPDGRAEALGDIDQCRRRTRMQTMRGGDDGIEVIRQIIRQRLRGRLGRCGSGGQPLADIRRIGGPGEPRGLGRIAEDIGQVGQDLKMLVGLGRDPHHQMHAVARIPLHAVRHLQHGHAGLLDHPAVLGHTVGDGDAVAEKGVGDAFTCQQAVDIARLDVARLDQDPADLTDGVGLVDCGGAETHRGEV